MNKLFNPAIHLMNNLSYSRKFLVLGGLSLIALLIVSIYWTNYLSGLINTANQQLTGLIQTQKTSRLIQLAQQHRGLSSSVIAKVKGSANKHLELKIEFENHFLKVSGALPLPLKNTVKWLTITEQWQYLKTKGMTLTRNQNFNLHTKFISNIKSFQLSNADHYNLLIVADLDSYYLTNNLLFPLPATLELLAQVRGLGVAYLANKDMKNKEMIIKLLSNTTVPLGVFKENVFKIKRVLISDGENISAQVLIKRINENIKLISNDIDSDTTVMNSLTFYHLMTSVIDDGYQFLDRSLSFTLKSLLRNRVKQANYQLMLSVGFSSVLFFIVLYFIMGLYYSTIKSIDTLTQVTGKFYSGDFSARVTLDTRDELNNIAIGFNKMAESIQNLMVDKEEISTRLRAIIDNSPIGIWFTDTDGRYHFVNKTITDLVGASEEEFVNTHPTDLAELLGEEVAQCCIESNAAALKQDFPHVSYESIPRLYAKPSILEVTKVKLKTPFDEVIGLIGISIDITEQRQQEEDLKLADMVYQNSSEAMMITNGNNEIMAINPALSSITGYSKKELIGENITIFRSNKTSPELYQSMWKDLKLTGRWQGEISTTKKDGTTYPEWISTNTVYDDLGNVLRRISLFSDITAKKEADEKILRQANYDSLTELPNRRMFIKKLEEEIKLSEQKNKKFALIFIDLDNFKIINDSKGHDFGDAIIVETGKRVNSCVRQFDTVARLGGDEFTIILSDLSNPSDVATICQKIIDVLSEPFYITEIPAYMSASLGVTLYPKDASTTSELLKNADQAMYLAKSLGRNRFCYFTASMQEQAQNNVSLINDLRKAISLNQLAVFYQPIVELQTGGIQKAEALLRWTHPTRGMVSPAEFIPLAEQSGLIVEIGDWVFKQTVLLVKKCKLQLDLDIQISVNKSPVQFRESTDQLDWLVHLNESKLSGESIAIEITEGLLMNNNDSTMKQLSLLRAAGIELSMDDFGTGYSSLSYLKKFELDYLKIDRSFTKNLAVGSKDMALSEAIITMAQKLGLKVIAEGIETEQQMSLLIAAGCDYAQGYYFSRPIPEDELLLLLTQRDFTKKLSTKRSIDSSASMSM